MADNSESRDGIRSSATKAGGSQAPWRSNRIFSAVKQCARCGEIFHPIAGIPEVHWNKQKFCSVGCGNVNPRSWRQLRSKEAQKPCKQCGVMMRPWTSGNSIQGEKAWNAQECCSQSCAKKYKNPMHADGAIKKLKNTLHRIGHRPIKQGGNGKPFTEPQVRLLKILGSGWRPELAVKTFKRRGSGYPHCYKIDVANETLKIGIEVDGPTHDSKAKRILDQKKDQLLATLGWKVYRVKNADALRMCSISESADTLLTLLKAS